MEKVFNPAAIEKRWYPYWENGGLFRPQGSGEPFCIVIPPPNVTGTLHMGHAFQNTLMDCLVRYQRMRGKRVLWQAGTDHAGIATQMIVERCLEAEGKSRHELGREKFVKRVWEWREESGGMISRQLRRLGSSLDWERECFTMDKKLSRAVFEAFTKLYDDGFIYRGNRLVNWDPVLKTAISDLEVVTEEEPGKLWYFRYPLQGNGEEHLTIATTRPETILGDTALAVNPDDPRYEDYVGKYATVPFAERRIPIIADPSVDPSFGSGCVKITPAHDFNDYEMAKRHNLEFLNIFDEAAVLNENAPQAYRGKDRYAARKAIVSALTELGLLEAVKTHRHAVPRGDRSHTVIEPRLTEQWFVRTDTLAEKAMAAVRNKDMDFVPQNWEKTYFDWLENIQDWCISRQLWWGHRIPAWYDAQGKIYVAPNEAQARKKYGLGKTLKLSQDNDVLDTWFSSALWPFATLGWPDNPPEVKDFYPNNVLITGFDIIFFWVARMAMMGLQLTGEVPFRQVYIHGLVRDSENRKMSKSKGNIIDPLDLIDGTTLEDLITKRTSGLLQPKQVAVIETDTRKQFPDGIDAFGADALRFAFTAMTSTGRDIRFDLQRIRGYRNFCNKLWNAARFVILICEKNQALLSSDIVPAKRTLEHWLEQKLANVIARVERNFTHYRFDLIANALYEFVWHDYCDWFIEMSKVTQQSGTTEENRKGNLLCMIETLERSVRLLHPIIPFITEEIWQQCKPLHGGKEESIMQQAWPRMEKAEKVRQESHDDIEWLQAFITGVRNIRSEMRIPLQQPVPVLVQYGTPKDRSRARKFELEISKLAKVSSLDWLDDNTTPPRCLTALFGKRKLLVPLEGLVDSKDEIARLNKQIEKLGGALNTVHRRLESPGFAAKAPPPVRAQQHQRAHSLTAQISALKEQLSSLQ